MFRWQTLASILVCTVYGGVAGYLLAMQFDPGHELAFGVVGLLVGVLAAGCSFGRNALKVAAFLHAAIAILAFRIFVRDGSDGTFSEIAIYVALGVTLPGLVLAFAGIRNSQPYEQNLPPGYDHVARASEPLAAWKKVGLVLLVSFLLVAQMFSMVLFYLALLLPVGFGVYYGIRMIRSRKAPTPTVARRLSVPSQREIPAQTKSHWTVIPTTGDDDRM
jgi:hypothetical protein